MFQGGIVRAHGGQGAAAGSIVLLPRIHAVVRPSWGVIRVWQGSQPFEDFTYREARAMCVAGDAALLDHDSICQLPGMAAFHVGPDGDGQIRPLIVARLWLVALLAAVRKALRTLDTAEALFAVPSCIDIESDPGSWGRHLRHMEALTAAPASNSS